MPSSLFTSDFLTTGDGMEFVFFTLRVGVEDVEGYFFSGDAGDLLGVVADTLLTVLLLLDDVLFYFVRTIGAGATDLICSGTLLRSSLLGEV